jgi:hypothetical protein
MVTKGSKNQVEYAVTRPLTPVTGVRIPLKNERLKAEALFF